MQQDKPTLSDPRKAVDMDTMRCLTGKQKLMFLVHLASKSDAPLEKQCLFAWIHGDSQLLAKKRGRQLRHQLWQLLDELRVLIEEPRETWPSRWIAVGQDQDGTEWHRAVQAWVKKYRAVDHSDTWEARHAPGCPAEKKAEKARARAQLAYGCGVGQDGKYIVSAQQS